MCKKRDDIIYKQICLNLKSCLLVLAFCWGSLLSVLVKKNRDTSGSMSICRKSNSSKKFSCMRNDHLIALATMQRTIAIENKKNIKYDRIVVETLCTGTSLSEMIFCLGNWKTQLWPLREKIEERLPPKITCPKKRWNQMLLIILVANFQHRQHSPGLLSNFYMASHY